MASSNFAEDKRGDDFKFRNYAGKEVFRVGTFDDSTGRGRAITNFLETLPSEAGDPVVLKALGEDTDISIELLPKGTGIVQGISSSAVPDPLEVDVINERTSDSGVTVDGVLVKDTSISFDAGTNALSQYVGKTSWNPTLTPSLNLTGTPTVDAGFYNRIGDQFTFTLAISGYSSTDTALASVSITLPNGWTSPSAQPQAAGTMTWATVPFSHGYIVVLGGGNTDTLFLAWFPPIISAGTIYAQGSVFLS